MTILSPAGPVPSTVKVYVRRRRGGKPVNVTLPDEPVSEENSQSKVASKYICQVHLPHVLVYMAAIITVL